MNCYPIRYIHLGRFFSRRPWFGRLALAQILFVFTPYFGLICLFSMFLYVLSPLVTWRVHPSDAARETRS
jgi:hypothetical protein